MQMFSGPDSDNVTHGLFLKICAIEGYVCSVCVHMQACVQRYACVHKHVGPEGFVV